MMKLLEKRGKREQGNSGAGCTYTTDILSYCASMDEGLDVSKDAPRISVDYKPISTIFEQLTIMKRKQKAAANQSPDELNTNHMEPS